MKLLFTVVWSDGSSDIPIGFMPQRVFDELTKVPVSIRGQLDIYHPQRVVKILIDKSTEKERSETIAALAQHWRRNRTFKILDKWRNELWPVYGNSGELIFSMERMAVGLFGCMRYGVHMTAYTAAPQARHGIKIWVAKRAADKSSYPGMLDNTAAGGFMTGEDFFECMVREADEEAALPEVVMRERAKMVGTVSYLFVTDERAGGEPGWIYPECQWVYDLELPTDIRPKPKDGEVESFALYTVDEVKEQMAQGLYKPNCAVVMLDFFIRHGILTKENEPDLEEINTRLHRVMPFPGPHREFEKRAG
jgi:8-oxo-dGTP pyrophosphatase MutT (NUDIX family)